ncbi:S1 RNA-binding domain-containing protein [Streptomyces sp. NPDC001536]|uniref:S1 RNA-binding domain-containing protein n=1 Tax=Streptomyces sp. NPDC001536 TaxID=3364583 RepID=UPI0036A5E793
MPISATDAYARETHLPALVERALTAARAHGSSSVRPELGRLLHALAGGAEGAVATTGAGCGVGLAWLASGAREGVRIVGVERDPERARIAAEVFADRPEVEVRHGTWRRIVERGPYDLLVLDGDGTGTSPDDDPADPARLLTPDGTIVIDGFTPPTDDPALHDREVGRSRQFWLRHSALETLKLPLAPDLAPLVATRRQLAGTETTWRGFEQGQVVRGVVTRIERFGVFVDVDGSEGFISAPELTRRHFDSYHDVVHVGQEVIAEVLAYELFRPQVRISTAALEPDPLAEFARQSLGRTVAGTVTRVVPFGVFVRVAEGIHGLVHLDDLEGPALPDAGTALTVEVTDINLALRRVRLRPAR